MDENIENQDVDVIVNPTNPKMTNNSGISYNIISKAGRKVKVK